MKKITQFIMVCSIILSAFCVSAAASTISSYDADGTLRLEEYPEMKGAAEKQALANVYLQYLSGKANQRQVKNALKGFYSAAGSATAIKSIGTEALFYNSSPMLRTVVPYNKSILYFTQFP
jgi:CBS domain containing-hemolysin-like protein